MTQAIQTTSAIRATGATAVVTFSPANSGPHGYPRDFVVAIEQMPLFSWRFDDLVALPVDGQAEIGYGADGHWSVTDLKLQVENYKFGIHNVAALHSLDADADRQLYWVILHAFMAHYGCYVEERISEELADAGDQHAA